MSNMKARVDEAIEASKTDKVIPDDVALYLIETYGLRDVTKGRLLALRVDPNANIDYFEASALYGWMRHGGVRIIDDQVIADLRKVVARGDAPATPAVELRAGQVAVALFASDVDGRGVVQIDTAAPVRVVLNEGALYDGDPNRDGVIPFPEPLARRLFAVFAEEHPYDAIEHAQLVDDLREVMDR